MPETREKNSHVWEQNEHHWYVEGQECTRALLRVEAFNGPIWDPSCGQGNIVRSCIEFGYEAFGTDIVEREPGATWFRGIHDFTAPIENPFDHATIVMNPPFFRAVGTEQFIRRAWEVATHKIAVFTDVKFIAGGARAERLYKLRRPNRIWYLSPRPSCQIGRAHV